MSKDPYELLLKKFERLTEIQEKAFPIVESGNNCIITAPTGSGKTEAAIMPVLKGMVNGAKKPGIYAIYITPLKALNRDLMKRLEWICGELEIDMKVRHGDTPLKERARQAREPPQLIITTPESLQNLFLSERLKNSMKNLKVVIVDELHELYHNKRGAQLSIALERVEELSKGFQRIGISATIGNVNEAAKFIFGDKPYKLVESERSKELKLTVEMPLVAQEQHKEFKEQFGLDMPSLARIERIAELIKSSDATLIFANTRQVVESLGSKLIYLNKIEKFGSIGIHHGSLDKEERVNVENEFKEGKLKAIIATSSLELGIDIGRINLVIQYSSPRQAIRLVQRIGRGGHREKESSTGRIIVASVIDALESASVAYAAINKRFEKLEMEYNALDVLVNQVCAMMLEYKSISAEKMYEIVKRAAPYKNLSRQMFAKVIDFINQNHLVKLNGVDIGIGGRSRSYFIRNISVIPETAHFYVKNLANNRIISVLDERFIYNYVEENSSFITKGLPWKVITIEKNIVYVEPSINMEAAIPDWEGEDIPVAYGIAQYVFEFLHKEKLAPVEGIMDRNAYETVSKFIEKQKEYFIPDSHTVIIEEMEGYDVIYIALGKLANEFLSKVIGTLVANELGGNVAVKPTPYAIVVDYSLSRKKPNIRRAFDVLKESDSAVNLNLIMSSEIFRYKFIQIGKLFGVIEKDAKVTRGNIRRIIDFYKDSPILTEVMRDISKNNFDFDTVKDFVDRFRDGKVTVKTYNGQPSPLSNEILKAAYHYKELLLPILPSSEEVEQFKSNVESKSIDLLCTFCGFRFGRKVDLDDNEKILCKVCKSPMLVMHNEEYEDMVKKRLSQKLLKNKEHRIYEEMMKEASLVDAYGDRAIAALATYGIGLTTAARFLKLLRKDNKQFIIDLVEAQKAFVRNKKFWKA